MKLVFQSFPISLLATTMHVRGWFQPEHCDDHNETLLPQQLSNTTQSLQASAVE